MPKLQNILIFIAIGLALVLIYILYGQSSPEEDALVSSVDTSVGGAVGGEADPIAQDFLNLLLSVKSIKLESDIFSTNAFMSLSDSSMVLEPDGNEGRPNPFAPIGTDFTPSSGIDTSVSPPATTPTPPTKPATKIQTINISPQI